MLKPKSLKRGDSIAIVSPSSEILSFPKRLNRGISALKCLGYNPVLAPNALKKEGHQAGSAKQRADDIMWAFTNPDIQAVICSTGGWNSNAVLPLLDYKLIARNPKLFIGYSDITALLNAIVSKSGLVTFHGPTVLPTFGEFGGPIPFALESFLRMVGDPTPIGKLPVPHGHIQEILWWESQDVRPREIIASNGPRVIRSGTAEGVLVGGNLETIVAFAGTSYFPDTNGAILMLEDSGGSTDKTERDLVSLELRGLLKNVKGLVYGRPCGFRTASQDRTLDIILAEIAERLNIPIIADVACGHADPSLTLPIGVPIVLNANDCSLTINEKVVI